MDEKRALLRHTVATVAYRGGKAVRGVPTAFASFSGDGSTRTFQLQRQVNTSLYEPVYDVYQPIILDNGAPTAIMKERGRGAANPNSSI